MTRTGWLAAAIGLVCASPAVADDWWCLMPPGYPPNPPFVRGGGATVYYVQYPIDPCPPTVRAAKPVTAAKTELAPPPRSTPRGTAAPAPGTAAPAPSAPPPAGPARVPSVFSRDYPPETPAAPGIEPSSPPRKPEVSESIERKQYYDAYFLADPESPAHRPARDGTRSVTFWNLSARRVTLQVEGKPHILERGQQVALALPMQFQWQIDGREVENAAVEEDRPGMEIVIRR